MDKSLKYYIAGPMTGIPQFNIPAFDAATKLLRYNGYDITSPAELDSAEMRRLALLSPDGAIGDVLSEGTWGDCLARDVKMIADELDAIILLPGWEKSRGANLEAFVGLLCGKPFFAYGDERFKSPLIRRLDPMQVHQAIASVMMKRLWGTV